MTDLEIFKALLERCPWTSFNESRRPLDEFEPFDDEKHAIDGDIVVRVHGGYRAHFEAVFDNAGKIKSIGQWEDM